MYATVDPDPVSTTYLEAMEDPELVRMVRSGSDAALGVLLRRHREALYRFCLHLTQNRDDAEDVCQESMARAITRVDQLNSGSAFRSWLFSIARNLSMDAHRNSKRLCPIPDEEFSPLPLSLYQEGPHVHVEAHEEYTTVAQALSRLKKNHQTVLMMREVEGMSYAEIAAHLDVSQAAVETLLFRARKRLREEYGKSAAPVPAFAFLGGLRSLLARLASPFTGGAPLAAKLGATVLFVGGAAIGAPHLIPAIQAAVAPFVHASSSPSSVASLPGRSSNSTLSPTGLTGAHATSVHGAGSAPGSSARHGTRAGHHASPSGANSSRANGVGMTHFGNPAHGGSKHGGSTVTTGVGASGTGSRIPTASAKGSPTTKTTGGTQGTVGSGGAATGGTSGGTTSGTSGATHHFSGSGPSGSGGGTAGGPSGPTTGNGNTTTAGGPTTQATSTASQVTTAATQTTNGVTTTATQASNQVSTTSNQVTTAATQTVGSATNTANTTTSNAQNTANKTTSGAQSAVSAATSGAQSAVNSTTGSAQKTTGSTPPAPSAPKVSVPVPTPKPPPVHIP